MLRCDYDDIGVQQRIFDTVIEFLKRKLHSGQCGFLGGFSGTNKLVILKDTIRHN